MLLNALKKQMTSQSIGRYYLQASRRQKKVQAIYFYKEFVLVQKENS